ncbi:MAG: hypothetical protein DDT19_02999 [Syntrophomonadaceae bacterium]|nr:hypothetical protein [Bacillota bacterium]
MRKGREVWDFGTERGVWDIGCRELGIRDARKILPHSAWEELKQIEQSAWDKYEAMRDSAQAECEKITKPAWAKYWAIVNPARDKYGIIASPMLNAKIKQSPYWSEYEKIELPARTECYAVVEAAQAECNRVKDLVLDEYKRTVRTAFSNLLVRMESNLNRIS